MVLRAGRDFGHEMDSTTDRLSNTLKKLDKVMNVTKDGKQSCAIVMLLVILLILIIVYFT